MDARALRPYSDHLPDVAAGTGSGKHRIEDTNLGKFKALRTANYRPQTTICRLKNRDSFRKGRVKLMALLDCLMRCSRDLFLEPKWSSAKTRVLARRITSDHFCEL